MVTQLQRLSRQQQEERQVWARERQELNDEREQELRRARLETCLLVERARVANQGKNTAFKRWAAAVSSLALRTLAQRREQAEELQRRSGDVGRTPLAEHESLLKQLAEAGLQRHRVQGKLASCSQELERTTASHTMMLELWAIDAEALRSRMLQSHSRHDAEMSTTQVAAAAAGEAQSGEILAERARGADVLGATCAALRAELAREDGHVRVAAAQRLLISWLCSRHAAVARAWAAWSHAASLTAKEAHSALGTKEQEHAQQRAVFTRVQERPTACSAPTPLPPLPRALHPALPPSDRRRRCRPRQHSCASRTWRRVCSYERCKLTRGLEHADPYGECQHITCNELLTLRVAPQAGVLAELQPTHVLATDKELVKQQRSELHAAKEAKLAAEQQAGKEAAAAQRIAAELELSQAKVAELCDQSDLGSSKADEAHARLLVQAEDRLSYERTSHDFLLKEQQRTAAALQRASCEARVLVSSIRRLEADVHERMQLGPSAAREAAVSGGARAPTPTATPAPKQPSVRPAATGSSRTSSAGGRGGRPARR